MARDEERWSQAAARFSLLVTVDPFDGPDVATLDYLRLGPVLIELREANRYERFRQETLARFAAAPCPFPDRILKICLLLPASDGTGESLAKFAETTMRSLIEAEAENDAFRAAWRSVALALWEYRQGNYANALEWCRRCLSCSENNPPRNATAHLIFAMASRQLGQTEDALAGLAAGRDIVEGKFKGRLDRGTPVQGFWFDWDFARILFRECTELVGAPARVP